VFAERNQDDNVRYEQLRQWLENDEYTLPTRDLVECYFDWKSSNRVVWPFEGNRMMQPQWVCDVFKTIERIEEFYTLKKTVVPNVSVTKTTPD